MVESVEQVAQRLGCKRRRVFQLLKDGTLERAPRYGREIRIYSASVDRALAPAPQAQPRKRRERRADTVEKIDRAALRAELGL